MAKNVEIVKKKNESSISLLKRFGRKVQEAGVIRKSKSIRYAERPQSDFVKKKNKLKSLSKTAEFEKQIKLGKLAPKRGRR
jgi:ribosomal protein S21